MYMLKLLFQIYAWTHALKTPITSEIQNYQVQFEDADGDGYYWWGLGPKPANCPGPDQADGDDSDPTKGPLDQYGYCMPLGPVSSPVANFTADPTNLYEGGTVTFADASTNAPTSWSWTFEGGTPSTSTAQNPVVTYNSTGNFKVTLTATNSGGSDTKSVDNYITVNTTPTPPAANFIADNTSIKAGSSVQFSDLSSNNPTSWSWSFEGGTPATSTAKNPTVTYSSAGDFNVTLTATNADGSNTKVIDNYISVSALTPPNVNFDADNTLIKAGNSVQFSDLSSNNPTSWSWSFEGGTPATSTAQNPTVSYNSTGDFKVTLTATNADGSNTKVVDNFITVNTLTPPVVNFDADNTSIKVGSSVQFTDLSSNNPTSWSWSFEGGTPATSTAKNPGNNL